MKTSIPTNLILGFLGVGKTTAILDLLKAKPDGEVWAVLVNEFGEVGIDGAMLQSEGAVIKEIPGGCMCCVAGLPMQVGLNQLIRQARPDRLIIEPTGLGHPSQILETLTGEHYATVLNLGPVITLVDPRKLEDPRVLENVQFRDQVAAADILVANKTDLASPAQVDAFERWAASLAGTKRGVFLTSLGRLRPEWLDGQTDLPEVTTPHAHHHHDEKGFVPAPDIQEQPWQRVRNAGQGYVSLGWRIHPEIRFDEKRLMALAMDSRFERFKAVIHCLDGWRTLNMVDGSLSVTDCEPRDLSRIEVISAGELPETDLDHGVQAAAGLQEADSTGGGMS
ncbi:GTP-binding protein [Marinobacter sp. M216]|uniref:GTP-binding protein n=1 Tax=Marinobacter albus TaxID=3030833 RepID=A0ABT7HFN5_9GAMM|nr:MULTISPECIES: GTP-binding protein [unclassified Marinobacter]MBW7472632.1 GTP-binding protein [Marinobacter sp. F4218]MDK9559185.1 GTP-binding protein [Marinobacter sp. M216]